MSLVDKDGVIGQEASNGTTDINLSALKDVSWTINLRTIIIKNEYSKL